MKNLLKQEQTRKIAHLEALLNYEVSNLVENNEIDISNLFNAVEEVSKIDRYNKKVTKGFSLLAKAISLKLERLLSEPNGLDNNLSDIFQLKYQIKQLYREHDRMFLSKKEINSILKPTVSALEKQLQLKKSNQLFKAFKLFGSSSKLFVLMVLSGVISYFQSKVEISKFHILSKLMRINSFNEFSFRRLILLESATFILNFVKERLDESGIKKLMFDLKLDYFKSLIYSDIEYCEKNNMNEISMLLLRIDTIASSLYSYPIRLIDLFFKIFFSFKNLFFLNSKFLFFLSFLFPFELFIYYSFRRLRDYLESLSSDVDLRGSFKEIITNLQTKTSFVNLKLFTKEKDEIELFKERTIVYNNYLSKGKLLNNIFSPLETLLEKLFYIFSLYFGILFFKTKTKTKTKNEYYSIIEYITQAKQIFDRIRFLYAINLSLNEDILEPIEKIFDLINSKSKIKLKQTHTQTNKNKNKNNLTWQIEFKNVDFYYPTKLNTQILNKVTFKIGLGQHIGILGESGSGKSTILTLLLKLYLTTKGQITLGNININELSEEHIRKNIGLVTQNQYFPKTTVYDNLVYSLKEGGDIEEIEIERVLKLADVFDLFMNKKRFPQLLLTDLGKNCEKLSGGERQRLNLARVLIRRPKVLLLDEYTSALDENLQFKIQQSIRKLKEETPDLVIISIAHRLSNFRDCDRLFVIEKGRIIEQGTPNELMNNDKNSIFNQFLKRHNEAMKQ